jgi:uncharacterized protein (TIGR02246 family)
MTPLTWFRPLAVCIATTALSLIAVPALVAQVNAELRCRVEDSPNAPAEKDGSVQESVQGIYALLETWRSALRKGDIEAVANLVTEDAEFWSHGAAALTGRRALADAFRPFLTGYELLQDFDCHELIVRGDLAFMRGLERNRLEPRSAGETLEVQQRAFSVMRRGVDGRWRFARGMTNEAMTQ